jgi:hypothetical protein
MRFLCFLVTVGVLVLPPSFSYAEDLTTLDGKTFTNITEVTKYPKQVVFTCNENRASVAITNLPTEFREKYGIIIKTNTPMVSLTQNQTNSFANPVDLFLWQNRESGLEQEEKENIVTNFLTWDIFIDWSIRLRSAIVTLEVHNDTSFNNEQKEHSQTTDFMSFDIGEEAFMLSVFEKFLEWDNVATTNHAENFDKEIAQHALDKALRIHDQEMVGHTYDSEMVTYTFRWQDNNAELIVSGEQNVFGVGLFEIGNFKRNDIIHFQSLLKLLPSMKEKLSSAIRNKESQKDLFK